MQLVFKTLPTSVNATYKRGRNSFYKSKEAKEAQEAMAWEARSQFKDKPLSCSISVSITFFWPDMRRHDIDNGLKLLFDSLTGIVWDDDSQICNLCITKTVDRGNPRIEMVIESLT